MSFARGRKGSITQDAQFDWVARQAKVSRAKIERLYRCYAGVRLDPGEYDRLVRLAGRCREHEARLGEIDRAWEGR